MHPAFATIEFGPFKSDYHKAAVDTDFRDLLNDYLVGQLLPQVDEPFENTVGRLIATYDDQKYCGPNSAVRDFYTLDFEFQRPSGSDSIKADLAFSREQRLFAQRYRGTPFYLWTASRKTAQTRLTNEIKLVCDRILSGKIVQAPCPCCGVELQIINTPGLFDVSCPSRCFNYNFHRDAKTGTFQHGHFICRPREKPNQSPELPAVDAAGSATRSTPTVGGGSGHGR